MAIEVNLCQIFGHYCCQQLLSQAGGQLNANPPKIINKGTNKTSDIAINQEEIIGNSGEITDINGNWRTLNAVNLPKHNDFTN